LLQSMGITSRWQALGDGFRSVAVPIAPETNVIGDLRLRDLEEQPELAALVEQAQPLYDKYFHEDLLDDLRDKGDTGRLAFLVRPGEASAEARFCGVLVYKFWGPPLRAVSILRVAVPDRLRFLGYGRTLMKWIMQKATQKPRAQCAKVTLCAMPEAVAFYDRLGFAFVPDENIELPAETDDGVRRLPGAVWMEYKCGRSYKPPSRR